MMIEISSKAYRILRYIRIVFNIFLVYRCIDRKNYVKTILII